MSKILTILDGLNPLSTNTNCFLLNGEKKQDIPLSEFLKDSWHNSFNRTTFPKSIELTYNALVGNHGFNESLWEETIRPNTFKGVLDFLILPLVARQLWNLYWLQTKKPINSIFMVLGIFTARLLAEWISLARILIGIALTIILTPVVGLICLVRGNPLESSDRSYHGDMPEQLRV